MPAASPALAPEAREADPRRWIVLAVMCLSLLLIVMDNTIVNVAIPTLQKDLGATTSQLQWVVDAYVLVFAGLLLTMGSLGDRFGRRGALALGLAIMGSASALSAFAGSANQLIVTRAIMGIGGALIMPATRSRSSPTSSRCGRSGPRPSPCGPPPPVWPWRSAR